VGRNIQRHNGDERQRWKKGFHHRKDHGRNGAKVAKAFQQGLPEFQRSQLVEPAYHRHFHPACSFPLIFL